MPSFIRSKTAHCHPSQCNISNSVVDCDFRVQILALIQLALANYIHMRYFSALMVMYIKRRSFSHILACILFKSTGDKRRQKGYYLSFYYCDVTGTSLILTLNATKRLGSFLSPCGLQCKVFHIIQLRRQLFYFFYFKGSIRI